jgi:hypothetical protein
MKEKKKYTLFWWFISIAFIMFISLYIAMASGYYDAKIKENTTLTKENIEKFEQDIKEGKVIDVKEYLTKNKEDYNNAISKAGLNISESIEKFMQYGLGNVLDFVGKLFGA